MPGSNTVAQLRSLDAAGPAGFISNIAKGSGQERFVTLASGLPEVLVSPGEDADNVSLGGCREPVLGHQSVESAFAAAR